MAAIRKWWHQFTKDFRRGVKVGEKKAKAYARKK